MRACAARCGATALAALLRSVGAAANGDRVARIAGAPRRVERGRAVETATSSARCRDTVCNVRHSFAPCSAAEIEIRYEAWPLPLVSWRQAAPCAQVSQGGLHRSPRTYGFGIFNAAPF